MLGRCGGIGFIKGKFEGAIGTLVFGYMKCGYYRTRPGIVDQPIKATDIKYNNKIESQRYKLSFRKRTKSRVYYMASSEIRTSSRPILSPSTYKIRFKGA